MPLFSLDPLVLADAEAILPLADAKAHLRVIDDSSEDGLIELLRDAAVHVVSEYTMRPLASSARVAKLSGSAFACPSVPLGCSPVTAVASVTWLDAAGAPQVMDAADCRIVNARAISPAPGKSWPSGAASGDDVITVAFTAGYAVAPPPLIAAAKLMLGQMFDNRGAMETAGVTLPFPPGFTALCDAYRDPVI